MIEQRSNTKDIGDKSVSKVIAMLLDKEYTVLMPFGDNKRYDVVIEIKGQFTRIQVKTGHIRNGCIITKLYSTYKIKGKNIRRHYTKEEIDCFIIYSPDMNKFYKLDIKDTNVGEICLRINQPKSSKGNQKSRFNFAEKFEFKDFGELR
jgi:hypothetical protein